MPGNIGGIGALQGNSFWTLGCSSSPGALAASLAIVMACLCFTARFVYYSLFTNQSSHRASVI